MSTLLLKLSAPLQAWGVGSRFSQRTTRHEPTKSAVIGLIAAAQGRRRTDPIEDLLDLCFGVRIDQPGVVVRDFQAAHSAKNGPMPVSSRFYLSDAVFVVGLEADKVLLEGIVDALLYPTFPLFLGRRSCAPSDKLVLGLRDGGLVETLQAHPWEASTWFQRRAPQGPQKLEFLRDTLPTDCGNETRETVQDVPLSFSQVRRDWSWRDVVHGEPITVENSNGRNQVSLPHDPMSPLGMD
jgi:CRISPR system Cascade subunit CasD